MLCPRARASLRLQFEFLDDGTVTLEVTGDDLCSGIAGVADGREPDVDQAFDDIGISKGLGQFCVQAIDDRLRRIMTNEDALPRFDDYVRIFG